MKVWRDISPKPSLTTQMLSKRGMVIGFAANVNHGLGGLSARRNLNRSLRLLNTIYWICWDTTNGVY
jgi:hypothetical protein